MAYALPCESLRLRDWEVPREIFYMLFAYGKSTQEDLTPAQVRILGRLVREEFE
jgi:hypothetical protein